MNQLDRYLLTEDEKREITEVWRKLNAAGMDVSIHTIARVAQGDVLKWVFSEDKPCPSCEKSKSKSK